MFRIACVLGLGILIVSGQAYAQCTTTVPTGTISGVWTLAGSPYCVDGDLQVGVLAIEPGVSVKFLDNYKFEVGGVLTVIGTPSSQITFVNAPSVAGWQGISFNFSAPGSKLAFFRVAGAINGGIQIQNTSAPPVIQDCVITGNSRPNSGGGLYITGSGPLLVERCSIENNQAVNTSGGETSGGGIYVNGDLTLKDSTVINNRTSSSGSTGGTKYTRGGGLYVSGNLTLVRDVIQKNIASFTGFNSTLIARGAGLHLNGTASVINSVFRDNTSSAQSGGFGSSENYGGGLYVQGQSTIVNVVNSTISKNVAGSHGGGLYTESGTTTVVLNSIFWENGEEIFAGGKVTVSYSDVRGGYQGVGNINFNPVFNDPSGDAFLHLAAGSPCIDLGICEGVPADDIDGESRPHGASCDMGADEFTGAPPPPPPLGLVCDIQMSKTSYVTGDKVTAQILRLANPSTVPVPVEVAIWFEVPGLSPISFVNTGADGMVKLTANFNQNFGPMSLFMVTSAFPRGTYGFNCRIVDPVTKRPLAEDLNSFMIQ